MESIVEVNLHCCGKQAIIGVTDHGCGIPPSEYGRVFEKHYRIPGNNTVFGTGIGLYLVARIVEEHHGSFAVQSVDSGTTVTIDLPINFDIKNAIEQP